MRWESYPIKYNLKAKAITNRAQATRFISMSIEKGLSDCLTPAGDLLGFGFSDRNSCFWTDTL